MRTLLLSLSCGWLAAGVLVADRPGGPQSGWSVPAGAEDERNPLEVGEAVRARGRALFYSKCIRCHGPEGRGDGPDADRTLRERMNLTRADRAAANPDGIVFYKIWNGRSSPRMPRFSEELTREDAWAVVAFVQTLRAKAPEAR